MRKEIGKNNENLDAWYREALEKLVCINLASFTKTQLKLPKSFFTPLDFFECKKIFY